MLIDYESFDNVGSLSALQQKGGWAVSGNSPQLGAYGRNGTDGVRSADNAVLFSKTYPGLNAATMIMGLGCMPTNLSFGNVLGFYDAVAGNWQTSISWSAGAPARLQLRLGAYNGTLLATGVTDIVLNTYYYIEFKTTFLNVGGYAEVRVNGNVDITYSGDTQFSANAYGDRILFGEAVNAGRWWHDDYYLCDGTGGTPFNDFLGDVRCQSVLPTGDGASSQFIGSDGNSLLNYQLVDEPGGASGSDYVESQTLGQKDTYAMGDLAATTGTVHAVKPVIVATKTDAGSREIASVVRLSGGTEADGPNRPLTTGYGWHTDIRTTRPGGGSWTVADVNGMEVGQKVAV